MTWLSEQIRAVLGEHVMGPGIFCHCGWKVSHHSGRLIWSYTEQHHAHVAEVIAALLETPASVPSERMDP